MWRTRGVEAARELVSSALCVWVACTTLSDAAQTSTVAMAAGLSAASLSYACGAATSPLLTGVMCSSGRTAPVQAAVNVAAQFVGSLAAAGLMAAGSGAGGRLGGNTLPLGSSWRAALVCEAVATAMVVFTYMGARHESRHLVLGLGTAAAHAATYATSSSALNPFRALAPAIVSGAWGRGFWTFVAGPVLGAAAGAIAHRLLALPAADDGAPADVDAAMRRFREAERNFV
jgi:glycerol uptake facilitator-like aquaporin